MQSKYTPTHHSETLVLESIIKHNEVSRTELTEITQLTKSSISDIVKTLLEKKIITEAKLGKTGINGGRKPIYLNFNKKVGVIIGIEINFNFLSGALAFLNGEIIIKIIHHKKSNSTNIIENLKQLINELIMNMPKTEYGLIAITIAIPGTVTNNEIIFMPYLSFNGINIKEILEQHYGVVILLINEANASALGEYVFSSASTNLININISTGIGAGIISNGYLFEGYNGKAGEIGHSILFPHGRPCPCGNSGCLEQYASSKQLYAELLFTEDTKESEIIDYIKKSISENNQDVINKLKRNSFYLSIGINNIIEFYNPDEIIINSKLHNELPMLIDLIKNNLTISRIESISIRNSSLNDNSVILGCIAFSLQRFLHLPNLKFSHSNLKHQNKA